MKFIVLILGSEFIAAICCSYSYHYSHQLLYVHVCTQATMRIWMHQSYLSCGWLISQIQVILVSCKW